MTTTPKVHGYIRPRADKFLEAVISIPGRPKIRRATGCVVGQEEEAQRFLEVLVQELEDLAPATSGAEDLTFQQWGERWTVEREQRGVVSAADEGAHLRFHACPQLGKTKLRDLTKAQMIEWVRGLPLRTTDRGGKPLSPRYVHHVANTVRRLLSEAVDRDLIPVSPCAWKTKRDLPPKMDRDSTKRRTGGFQPAEVAMLLVDTRIPEERRVLYALEFLTGMRTGEAAARRWRDWIEVEPLGRLEVRTAWNTRIRTEKSTKTLVEKVVPVHPILARTLRTWKDEGWKRYVGRAPTEDDLIVPAERGGPRNASHSNKQFQDDLRTLELRALDVERRTHYETRASFRSLAFAGGANRADVDLITHPSPRQASELYTRLDVIWPALCRAVACIALPIGEVTQEVTRKEKAPDERGLRWRAVQDSKACSQALELAHIPGPRALRGAQSCGPDALVSALCDPRRDLPESLTDYLEAAARLAIAAVERGELGRARELFEDAARAIPSGAVLRVLSSL